MKGARWTPEMLENYNNKKPVVKPDEPEVFVPNKADVRLEKDLQNICNNYLLLNGYQLLTNDRAEKHATNKEIKGWYGHLGKAKMNPFMPDLFIFNRDMSRCIMVELKTNNKYRVGQKEMIEAGIWLEVRELDVMIEILKEFETEDV